MAESGRAPRSHRPEHGVLTRPRVTQGPLKPNGWEPRSESELNWEHWVGKNVTRGCSRARCQESRGGGGGGREPGEGSTQGSSSRLQRSALLWVPWQPAGGGDGAGSSSLLWTARGPAPVSLGPWVQQGADHGMRFPHPSHKHPPPPKAPLLPQALSGGRGAASFFPLKEPEESKSRFKI